MKLLQDEQVCHCTNGVMHDWRNFMLLRLPRPVSESSIQSAVLNLLRFESYSASAISIAVKDVEHDSVLIDIDADSMTNPASVLKLVTAAVAFEQWGLGYSFSTRIFADSIDRRDNTVTVRNLYIQGGADPGFHRREIMAVRRTPATTSGLRKISGNLVMDDYFFWIQSASGRALTRRRQANHTCRLLMPSR